MTGTVGPGQRLQSLLLVARHLVHQWRIDNERGLEAAIRELDDMTALLAGPYVETIVAGAEVAMQETAGHRTALVRDVAENVVDTFLLQHDARGGLVVTVSALEEP